jgi:hypothetical protein
MTWRSRCAALALLTGLPGVAVAQVSMETVPSTMQEPRLEGLTPRFTHLRVRTADGGELQGAYLRVRDDTLSIRGRPGLIRTAPPVRIPFASVDTLWVRRSAWKTGAAVGAVAGTALYLALASAVDGDDPEASAYLLPASALEAVALGVAVGGGNGALIGSLVRRWDVRFTRR